MDGFAIAYSALSMLSRANNNSGLCVHSDLVFGNQGFYRAAFWHCFHIVGARLPSAFARLLFLSALSFCLQSESAADRNLQSACAITFVEQLTCNRPNLVTSDKYIG